LARLNSADAEVAADQGEVDRLNALESFKKIIAPFDALAS
jgi:multidrug efflux pump subunit AcrA (membrane-fusion protein)